MERVICRNIEVGGWIKVHRPEMCTLRKNPCTGSPFRRPTFNGSTLSELKYKKHVKYIIMKNNIPYISLLWQGDTKLSRSSYSELCKNLIEREGHYFIKYGDNEWLIQEEEIV